MTVFDDFDKPMIKIFLNADVYAPEHLGVINVAVCAGRIIHAGKDRPEFTGIPDMRTEDLEGRRMIPGLIDPHVHVTGGGGEGGPPTSVPPSPLGRYTSAGVTTVLGMLGTDDMTRNTSSLIARTRALNMEGITAFCLTGGYHLPPTTLTGTVRDDIIHVEQIIGTGELAIGDHRSSRPTYDELIKLAAETYVAGMVGKKAGILNLHIGQGENAFDLIDRALEEGELPARVLYPTHVNRSGTIFDRACRLAERGCFIDVTAYDEPDRSPRAVDSLLRYLNSGLPSKNITVSSDAGGSFPRFDEAGNFLSMDYGKPSALHHTLKELLSKGALLEKALPPFTSNPAAVMGLHRKGTIAAGADADLAVLDEEGEITHVIARGRPHLSEGRALIKGTFEDSS